MSWGQHQTAKDIPSDCVIQGLKGWKQQSTSYKGKPIQVLQAVQNILQAAMGQYTQTLLQRDPSTRPEAGDPDAGPSHQQPNKIPPHAHPKKRPAPGARPKRKATHGPYPKRKPKDENIMDVYLSIHG